MRRSSAKPLLTLIVALVVFLVGTACAQKPSTVPQTGDELSNQTNAKTKSVLLKEILSSQPNFTAEEVFSEFEPRVHGGFSLANKIAKKGNCYRSEFDGNVYFFRPNMPTVNYYPKRKRFAEVPPSDDKRWYRNINHVEIFANEENITFEEIGVEVVLGHECIKIKVSKKDEGSQNHEETAIFYAAKDLNNLVIAIEVKLSDRTNRYVLRNISFDIPDELFTAIENYKPKRV